MYRMLVSTEADRRASAAGAVVLVVVAVLYVLLGNETSGPLSAFVLPALLAAVLGGWRPTLAVGISSLAVAVVVGLAGPLEASSLMARWLIVTVGVVMGVVGAAVRERQAVRLDELDETLRLREAFQRGLAPSPIAPDGIVVVAGYRAAESRMSIGGDFLEAVPLADGRLAVLVGDVCGHGPREAAFGAALRAGWKAIALSGKRDPVEWVEALDASYFADGRIDTFVTLCTGYFDVDDRVARLVDVGHPTPISLDRPVRAFDLRPAPPLGSGYSHVWTAAELPWHGEPVLLYTDGLVENPRSAGPTERWGTEGLLSWLDGNPLDATAGDVARLLDAASTGRSLNDDIAVLIVAADR